MGFLFYIDNQLTDAPNNDMDLSTTINRDRTLSSLLVTQDVRLMYSATNVLQVGEVSGFTLIHNAFVAGQCTELNITIIEQITPLINQTVYVGVIKTPSITWNLENTNVSVTIQDNSFYSYIKNNKSVEYNLQSVKTKNRLDILPPPIYEVDVFNSFTGVYGSTIGAYVRGYRLTDVFRYLVAAISDNKVGFESLYLQQSPEIFVFDGFALVNKDTDPNVKLSFAKLFEEINKVKNISFYIDTTDQTAPVMRLEAFSDLYSGLQVLSFEDIKEMTASITTDNIFGSIEVGAADNPGGADNSYTFNAGTSYLGWLREVYSPLGQCNIDNELNLVNDFGITNNDVNYQINGAVDSNLDKIFLIECWVVDDVNLTAIARPYPSWINTIYSYYNQGLNNPSKLLIHGSNYQTGLTNTLQIGTNGFQAALGQDGLIATYDPGSPVVANPNALISPMVFADETTGSNYDGNGNYGNTTGIYVAPQDGIYSFGHQLNLDVINTKSCNNIQVNVTASPVIPTGQTFQTIIRGFIVDTKIKIYTDATLTTLITETVTRTAVMNDQFNQGYTNSFTGFLASGSAVITETQIYADTFIPNLTGNFGIFNEINPLPGWQISFNGGGCPVGSPFPAIYALEDSIFFCDGSPDGGGVFSTNDPALFKNKSYQFTKQITSRDFELIKRNPTGQFGFEKDGVTRYGWIENMKRNDWTGITLIKLITSD